MKQLNSYFNVTFLFYRLQAWIDMENAVMERSFSQLKVSDAQP